MILSLT